MVYVDVGVEVVASFGSAQRLKEVKNIDSVVENVIGLERGPDAGLRTVFKELRSCTGQWSSCYLLIGFPSKVGTYVGGSYRVKEARFNNRGYRQA